MRTRVAAVGLIVGAALTVGIALAHDGSRPVKQAALADSLSLSQLVGQRIVTGYVGTRPTSSILRDVRSGHVGGVILFQNNIPTEASARRTITKLQRAARSGKQPHLLVMLDQEGGKVKRLPNAPPKLSPQQMGRRSNVAAVALREGRATGRRLKGLGFNINLAPVVDVPSSSGNFLGNRAYSRDRQVVADGACAFARGLQGAGVAATFKHFPGLGHAGADTDFSDVVINASRAQLEADWLPYRQCPDAAALTMISSARYPKLGSRRAAVFAPVAYADLAGTGFSGLTITDAFETPSIVAIRDRERRAIRAGVDIVLYGQAQRLARRAYKRLLADARAGRLMKSDLRASAAGILTFKNRLKRGRP